MPKSSKRRATRKEPAEAQPKERSQHDRAPYQKNSDRNPVKSAEETRHIPTQHGAIK
jgi:hypothetical protein